MKLRHSNLPFPPYTFLPGRTPHPRRDPKGHQFGKKDFTSGPTSPQDWKTTELYLYGVDLFNHAFFWEAHEAWEALWKPLDASGTHARFLQALIQAAASQVKKAVGQEDGYAEHTRQSRQKLEQIKKEAGPTFMGIEVEEFLRDSDKIRLIF